MARSTTGLLVGWSSIAAFCRLPLRTIQRYRAVDRFPAFRLGTRAVTTPHMIELWLLDRERRRRQRQRAS